MSRRSNQRRSIRREAVERNRVSGDRRALTPEQGSRAAFLVRQVQGRLQEIIAAYEMGLYVGPHDEGGANTTIDRWFQELCQTSNQLQSVTWKVPHLVYSDDDEGDVIGVFNGQEVKPVQKYKKGARRGKAKK